MSKSLILLVALLAVAIASDPFQDVRAMIKGDKCAIKSMEIIKPELESKLAQFKQDPNNLQNKVEFIQAIEKVKGIYDQCEINKKVQPMVGDAVEAAGVGFLLASNCFKDVGIVLLLADTVVQDPTDWTNDVIVAIFGYILGHQGYKDCSQFVNFII